MRRLSPWIVSCLALSACVPAAQTTAGLSNAPIAAVVPGPDQATMTFRLAVPAADRQVAYVSSGTVAVRILIGTAADGTPVYQGALGQPVAGQYGVYEITSTVPLGQQHFTVELYGDEAMTAPMLLATGEADQLIEKGKANRVALTLLGIPRTVKIVMTNPTAEPNANTITAKVQAYDAKGSFITGTYAKPVTLALEHVGTQLTPPADVVAETSSDTFAFGFTSGTLTDSWVTASAPGVDAASVTRAEVIRPCITRLTVTAAVPKAVLVGEPKSGAITATATYSDGRVDSDVILNVTEPGAGTVDTSSVTPTLVLPATDVTYATLTATGKLPRYTGLPYVANYRVEVASLDLTGPGPLNVGQTGRLTGKFVHPDAALMAAWATMPWTFNTSWDAPVARFTSPTTIETDFYHQNGNNVTKTYNFTLVVDRGSDYTWTKSIPVTLNKY